MQPTRQTETAAPLPFSIAGDPIPAPRRPKRKRRPVMGFAPRVALMGLVAVVGIFLFSALVSKAVQPYQMQRVQSSHIRQLKDQLGATNAENAELQTKIAALKRPDGVETEARAKNYLKPGEISLDITSQQPPPSPPPANTGLAGALQRMFNKLTGR